MSRTLEIKRAFDRKVRALRARPYVGRGTAVTRVRLEAGLRCQVREADWTLDVDMSPGSGGDGSAPNPGLLLRGALGGCLAIGYRMWAARLGVPIDAIEVVVHADYDARGEYGVADLAPGYSEVRYDVWVQSSAPEADIRALLDQADRCSSIRDVFAAETRLVRSVRYARTVGPYSARSANASVHTPRPSFTHPFA